MNLLSSGMIAAAIVFHAFVTRRKQEMPNEALRSALAGLTAEVAENTTKLSSIVSFVQGVPGLVAEAVRDALNEFDVEADEAAEIIDAARQTMSDNVDSVLAAINQNTPPEEPPEEPPVEQPVEPEDSQG